MSLRPCGHAAPEGSPPTAPRPASWLMTATMRPGLAPLSSTAWNCCGQSACCSGTGRKPISRLFFDLYSREDVMRWLGPHPRRALATPDEARERLQRWHARERGLDLPLGLWAIVPLLPRIRSGRTVGTIHANAARPTPIGPTGLIEVGWHLHPDHQGLGLATEAASAILATAARAGMRQILALTDPDNIPSQAVATRLGMRDEWPTQNVSGSASHRANTHGRDPGPGPSRSRTGRRPGMRPRGTREPP